MEKQLLETLREEVLAAPREESATAPPDVVVRPSSPDAIVTALRRDSLLHESLVRERSRADETNGVFWVVLLTAPAQCHSLRAKTQPLGASPGGEPAETGASALRLIPNSIQAEWHRAPASAAATELSLPSEAEVLRGNNGLTMIVWRGDAAPDLQASGIDAAQPLFRYPADPLSSSYHALETVFFRPTPGWKRACDLVGAAVALALLSPLLLVVTLLIKLGSPGPAIFKQRRLGGAGQPFTIWKFRTFRHEVATSHHQSYVSSLRHNNQPLRKVDAASRLIPCGHLLRACAIDELPQLFNVLQGSMSLVGPRPDVLDFDDYSSAQRRRFDVVPGMTGLWQVSGKNKTTFKQMIDLDIRYVHERSLWLDQWIMLMTVPAMVRQLAEEDSI